MVRQWWNSQKTSRKRREGLEITQNEDAALLHLFLNFNDRNQFFSALESFLSKNIQDCHFDALKTTKSWLEMEKWSRFQFCFFFHHFLLFINTSYLTNSYISFTLNLESGQNVCSNRSIRSSKYGKKIFPIFLHAGSWSFLLMNLWFFSKLVSKMN